MTDRIQAVREQLDAPALIVNMPNIRYLTGFTGSTAHFVVTAESARLIVDFRYIEQAKRECECEVILRDGRFEDRLTEYIRGARCIVESAHMTIDQFERLKLAAPEMEWFPQKNLVESVRIKKDETEIARLREATALLESLMSKTIARVRAGVREIDIALDYERDARGATARPLPFEPIIASGARSALPHGVASKKEIRAGEFVVVDIGLNLDGYVADMTRTVAVGEPDSRMKEIHEAVHLANRTAARGIKPGMTGEEAHMIAMGVLEAHGLGKYFGHGLGHGLGVEVHEEPRLAPKVKEKLEPGMVFTIEPGVYIPDYGGVRIEDSGVLRQEGVEIFNALPRALP